jgi:hypothetical protein
MILPDPHPSTYCSKPVLRRSERVGRKSGLFKDQKHEKMGAITPPKTILEN